MSTVTVSAKCVILISLHMYSHIINLSLYRENITGKEDCLTCTAYGLSTTAKALASGVILDALGVKTKQLGKSYETDTLSEAVSL